MSISLSFDCDPIGQPAAKDPVESLTWCALQIRVGERFASRLWDRSLRKERTNLYLPVFAVAQWIVENWWSLFYEPCRWENVPTAPNDELTLKWIRRHCLRSADSSLFLPSLYLYHDGSILNLEVHSDVRGSMQNMPGEFLENVREQLDADSTRFSLETFVNQILTSVETVNDDRVWILARNWEAIQRATKEEQQFCQLAGRMGLSPYDPNEMTESLTQFLEQTFTDPDLPLVRDLTEIAHPNSIADQWSWLKSVGCDFDFLDDRHESLSRLPKHGSTPAQYGYRLAEMVRKEATLLPDAPVNSVEALGTTVLNKSFRKEERNHVPGSGLQALVGHTSDAFIAVGPLPWRLDSRRFRLARGLYHAVAANDGPPRLVTGAFSWDQKASRAFAAELLAPQRALAASVSNREVDSQIIQELSTQYIASTMVIEQQLKNAGVAVSPE